ncbi:D-amino-acid transaminase [Entomohabitans teleogrylli]|uniref:D-amino-acid transaminase n=1 Tax=Entomohabitans teleogrylli TaxID=1384589 RepID=UPI00073D8EE8|nr:D-amino-acid transaminase [Entomohabitans teleogrylli]
MARIVYVNGDYVPESQAKVSVFDRGFLFADAVYEVCAVVGGKLVDFDAHMARLARSCGELSLACPWSSDQLHEIHQRLITENALQEGAIYLQLSRGNPGDRDFAFPPDSVTPTLVLFTQQKSLIDNAKALEGIRVVTCPDIRWQRRDIKTVGLLAACLAKTWALRHGVDDALLVEEGFITEGTSFNVFMVTDDNAIITRPLSHGILHGITRRALLRLAQQSGQHIIERAFTPEQARNAREVFVSSATSFIWPVVEIDGLTIADGKPGPVTRRLRALYLEMIDEQIG